MKEAGKRKIFLGLMLIALFIIFTCLLKALDVKPTGVNGTDIGFSSFNCRFHMLFGVNMTLYTITDWAGLVPIFVVFSFGAVGFFQLIKRRSLKKVDTDILILGVYYIVIFCLYALFEAIPVNYRPILINGFAEASYPSSTTLLTLGVMPTLMEQILRRYKSAALKSASCILTILFSTFTVVGRLVSGVHWFTDILGSVIISAGLFYIYCGAVLILLKKS